MPVLLLSAGAEQPPHTGAETEVGGRVLRRLHGRLYVAASHAQAGKAGVPMMVPSEDHRHPMAVAMEWVGRIMAAAMMMVLPGLGGQWIDRQLSTHWIALAGFAFGMSVSIYYLLVVTRPRNGSGSQTGQHQPSNHGDRPQ